MGIERVGLVLPQSIPVFIMHKNRLLSIAALLLMCAALCSSATAHDLPTNYIMNAFVKGGTG